MNDLPTAQIDTGDNSVDSKDRQTISSAKLVCLSGKDRDGKCFFRKCIKLGFGQNFCQLCYAFNRSATGDKAVHPLAPIFFFVVGDTVFKLLLFVLELRELAFIFCFLGFQLRDGSLFCHSDDLLGFDVV